METEGDTLQLLREELLTRLEERPMEQWSASLIRAVIVTMDLIPEGVLVPPEPGRRILRLIR